MKKLCLATLSTLALSLASTNVFATDGTITINGVITDGTCILEGYFHATGLKDITANLAAIPKSRFTDPTNFPLLGTYIPMRLMNPTGTGSCDEVTNKAFKGIHLSAISPTDLDATDKTLLVNKAENASKTNPVFVRIGTEYNTNNTVVDLSAPWGIQAKSPVDKEGSLAYVANYFSKTGIVDAQNVQAVINYTLHYN